MNGPLMTSTSVQVDGRDGCRCTKKWRWKRPSAPCCISARRPTCAQPRVLIVAPMAGHFATLLRHTARTMLADHDVYITDWNNARDVPLAAGRFGIDEYIEHLIRFFETDRAGRACHGGVPALRRAAGGRGGDGGSTIIPPRRRSMTLMAGPVDTRINPTEVNQLATEHPMEWFEKNLIATRAAPLCRRGPPRLSGLHADFGVHVDEPAAPYPRPDGSVRPYPARRDEKADANRKFYDDYLAVADLPAEFYLETVRNVFQEYHLARGMFDYRGEPVDPAAITQDRASDGRRRKRRYLLGGPDHGGA